MSDRDTIRRLAGDLTLMTGERNDLLAEAARPTVLPDVETIERWIRGNRSGHTWLDQAHLRQDAERVLSGLEDFFA